MARIPDRFVDDLRAALRIEEVAARHVKLRKSGTNLVAIDDESLVVTPSRGMWKQFGNGRIQGGGDVFAFEMAASGCTFHEAVERLAAVAGMQLPPEARSERKPNGSGNGRHGPPEAQAGDPGALPDSAAAAAPSGSQPRKPKYVFPYCDADNLELYQVARFEWVDDKGVRHKSTPPRRACADEPGKWVWGLRGGEYLRGNSGDWYFADAKRKREWVGAERRSFDEVAPSIYRLPELLAELAQEPDDQRTVHLPEGELKVDKLIEWGLCAAASLGGSTGWRPHFAEYFRGADVIVHVDNDAAGRKHAQIKAAALRQYARRVRMLDWGELWPAAKLKDDFVDWRDRGGGTLDGLFEIIDRLPDWVPQPPASSFGAQRFSEIDRPGKELEWLIKFVITRGEVSIWYGQYGSGKSFLVTDAALAIARGVQWMGQRTRPGLVVYQAGEGGLGLRRRLRAYRKHFYIEANDELPFVLLPSRIDIFSADADVDKLILEVKAWAAFYDLPLELVVLDTLNAASPGADENSSKDIGPVLNRARKISLETGAHVLLVDHVPKEGASPRGWSGKMGNVDSAVLVNITGDIDDGAAVGDNVRREVRELTITKQKDEADKLKRRFVLRRVVLGTDPDGDPISSCVVQPLGSTLPLFAAAGTEKPAGWAAMVPANEDIFRALVRALRKHGRPAPADTSEPPGTIVCTIAQWQAELIEDQVGHVEITPTLEARIKKRIYRASKAWNAREESGGINIIGKHKEWVWRTSRKVWRVDEPPKPRPMPVEPEALRAPGETIEDIQKGLI